MGNQSSSQRKMGQKFRFMEHMPYIELSGRKITCSSMSPDSTVFAIGSHRESFAAGDLTLLDSDGNILASLDSVHSDAIWSIVFAPDSSCIFSASEDGTLRIWYVQTGHTAIIHTTKDSALLCVAVSPCGRFVACGSVCGSVYVYDRTDCVSSKFIPNNDFPHSECMMPSLFCLI
eukprot:GDKK01045835.1.p1 GENE.GDKK01045835.1~~GDKK01045835.1.p1  ORF type:complete len:175 (-),score=13.70 GDKK01045835.1:5-529(-)